MRIGGTELALGLMLAPMAGYTDRAMRLVARKYGAEYSVTEMVSAKAVTFGDKKTFELARILPDEGPVAVQIFGSEPEIMAAAAQRLSQPLEGVRPVAIDINMGCPVHKIFSNGEGSALMGDPALIERIVRGVCAVTDLPVTVKLRLGIDRDRINAAECADAAVRGGAAAICMHGRTRADMYGGRADREMLARVREGVRVPFIANGDITSADEALDMLATTAADGIAIGRGAVGNPFIFAEITAALTKKRYTPPTLEEKIATALDQLRAAVEEKGEARAIPEARKQIALYLRGFRGAASARAEINRATTYSAVESALAAVKDEEMS